MQSLSAALTQRPHGTRRDWPMLSIGAGGRIGGYVQRCSSSSDDSEAEIGRGGGTGMGAKETAGLGPLLLPARLTRGRLRLDAVVESDVMLDGRLALAATDDGAYDVDATDGADEARSS